MRNFFIAIGFLFLNITFYGQSTVTVNIDASSVSKPISPFIFGKNNNLSDNSAKPLTAAQWQRLRDLGIKLYRENGGNNASKYNWRRKLSSHPDWYNNVYSHNWDFAAKSLQTNIPSAQGLWGFQLTGKAAKNTSNNFNDWGYNTSKWWDGVAQNLAGGGTVNTAGGVEVTGNKLSVQMAPLSISAVVLKHDVKIQTVFGDLVAEAEAESGILSGVYVSKNTSGFSGTGFVTGFDNAGDNVLVNITIPENGFYKIVIRYNGTSGDKYQDFSVNNGFSSSVHFPASNTFAYTEAGSYILKQGVNTLSVIKSWGWTDIDKFEVYSTIRNVFKITPDLVDPSANNETKALYQFLLSQFGERIISGQTRDRFNDIKTLTGKAPMLQASDFARFSDGYPYKWNNGGHTFGKDDDGSIQQLINWYNSTGKKGIVAMHWHWCSPGGGAAGTNTFYTEFTTFDITKAVTPGTTEYDLIIRDIDAIAVQLKKFQDAGVPILWRPLHEAGGGWFWWGAKGPVACKKLYDIMFERLKNYHQLHNLIWVWSTPETDWYPGNDKVDIIGHDSYPGTYNYGNQKNAFDRIYQLTNGEKLIAMTENGPVPDPDESLQYDAPWSFFMSWVDLAFTQNSNAHLIDVYNNPSVMTLESDQTTGNIKFRLNSGGSPLNEGLIKVNENSILTNTLGIALFKQLPMNVSYNYSISKSGYNNQSGDFILSNDTIIDLTINKYPVNSENNSCNDKIKVWPNPSSEFLYCSFPAVYLNSNVLITDIFGNEFYSGKLYKDPFIISLRNYPPGTYFLRLIAGNESGSRLFIRE